jgi:RNA polymerase sigma factor (sigma-70 family)
MTSDILDRSLEILSDLYGKDVTDYVLRVIRAESRAGGFEPEEVVSIAYIVLARAKELFDDSRGQFKNYAIRSLKNELIRSKTSAFKLLDDYGDDDSPISRISQVSDSEALFSTLDEASTSIEQSIDLRDREQMYLLMSSALLETLTPLERALLYITYYTSPMSKSISLLDLSKAQNLSYYVLNSVLRSALEKIREALYDSKHFF